MQLSSWHLKYIQWQENGNTTSTMQQALHKKKEISDLLYIHISKYMQNDYFLEQKFKNNILSLRRNILTHYFIIHWKYYCICTQKYFLKGQWHQNNMPDRHTSKQIWPKLRRSQGFRIFLLLPCSDRIFESPLCLTVFLRIFSGLSCRPWLQVVLYMQAGKSPRLQFILQGTKAERMEVQLCFRCSLLHFRPIFSEGAFSLFLAMSQRFFQIPDT